MFALMKIAWRNIWRNQRRSGIVIISNAVGIWGMLFSLGFINGLTGEWVENAIRGIGHLQIHNTGYPAKPEAMGFSIKIGPTIVAPEKVETILDGDKRITAWSPRMKTMGLISNAGNAMGIFLFGVVPEKEERVSRFAKEMSEGEIITSESRNEIVIGKALAERLEVGVGSKIVITTQNLHQEKAANAFVVKGIYQSAGFRETMMVFANIKTVQSMIDLPGGMNEISLVINNPEQNLEAVAADLQSRIGSENKANTWKEIAPILVSWTQLLKVTIFVVFVLIFIAMAFGIANTVLMAVFERIHELGIMKALGTTPTQVFLTVIFECIDLGLIGVATGTALGWLTVFYFGQVGIDMKSFADAFNRVGIEAVIHTKIGPAYIWLGAATALLMSILAALWPAIKASKLVPIDAIKHV